MRNALMISAALLLLAAVPAVPAIEACTAIEGICITQSWQPLPDDLGYYRQTCVTSQVASDVCVLP